MGTIIWSYIQTIKRQPLFILGMIGLTILFASILGQGSFSEVTIPAYTEGLTEEQSDSYLARLNEHDRFHIQLEERTDVETKLRKNVAQMALILREGNFEILVATETENIYSLETHISAFYREQNLIRTAADQLGIDKTELEKEVLASLNPQMFTVDEMTYKGQTSFLYDQGLQALFGFSLFFVIYSVMYMVNIIVIQKEQGIWDRLILSGLKKTEIYLGHLVFSLLLGYMQIFIVFFLFKYAFGVEFYGGFWITLLVVIPYLFAIVSIGVLIAGFIKSAQQVNVIIPIVSVSFAMLGGAYWPIEIVTSDIIRTISYFVPVTYGMELLKGATLFQWSFHQFIFPTAVLVFMGVLAMGVGLNLMERKQT
ncbi:ABC transporter permease [Evansella tamaricis]|uniref:ABC transporter permease n=1 Tax=Evansella tamaricis TaxID=2069301 RepID=A0ABS6JJ56_9BACI|nr:ABC transporter permease [Evansella tamaricis]MBU9712358.1 ABC transporter permease [Evansella tamaricis]